MSHSYFSTTSSENVGAVRYDSSRNIRSFDSRTSGCDATGTIHAKSFASPVYEIWTWTVVVFVSGSTPNTTSSPDWSTGMSRLQKNPPQASAGVVSRVASSIPTSVCGEQARGVPDVRTGFPTEFDTDA